MRSKQVRRVLVGLLGAYLVLAAVLFGTMDSGLGGGAVDDVLSGLIDVHELIGFGMFPVGLGVVALALVVAILATGGGEAA